MSTLALMLLQAPASNPLGSMFLPVAMVVIMYFIILRPMQQQKKSQAAMLASLEAGREVLTTGGIIGTIVSISGDTLIVRVKPDNVKLQMSRAAIATVVTPAAAAEEKK